MRIEPATSADLEAIHEIERHSFPRAWLREQYEAELVREGARVDVVRDPKVIGFCNYWLVAVSGEVHILSIATHPDRRRSGMGGALLAHALDAGRAIGATVATLEVRRSNKPAIAMYERAGFRTVHVRARYYQDGDEDALVMLAPL
ncbi:MAG: ribosomal protein S18-alanine N-acetyltransferase [Kofleriaceae bacterium]|nr:ribosomal protein S18-alanine N-acetyltransferase [Kofleriaceae bacterium]